MINMVNLNLDRINSVDDAMRAVAHFTDCWVMRFPEGGVKGMMSFLGSADVDEPPPRYGDGIAARQAEWILQPAATLCQDVCAGLTLRKLTSSDRANSVVARSIEDCCGWSWAGFGGLKFHPNGEMTTPWGKGIWGAPPEAQTGREGSILAEFAGFKHLVKATLVSSGSGVKVQGSMSSTRCSDNDRSTVNLASGTTAEVSV